MVLVLQNAKLQFLLTTSAKYFSFVRKQKKQVKWRDKEGNHKTIGCSLSPSKAAYGSVADLRREIEKSFALT